MLNFMAQKEKSDMKVFILADNQDITQEGIASLLRDSNIVVDIVVAENKIRLQDELKKHPAAVVVLDYTLFDFSSPEQMLITKEGAAGSSWVLFSDELGAGFLRQTLLCDASLSVVMKHDLKNEIREALMSAACGTQYICESAAQIMAGGVIQSRIPDKLTAMEREVLHEIALGKTTKEIAWQKNLSFHTVNSHRKNIFRKLEVNNVHEAIRYAFRAGIIDQTEYFI